MDDPSVTAHFGYPEAKWVCEQLLQGATVSHPSKLTQTSIVRIGQLVGSSFIGAWSPLEDLPSIFRSSLTIGALPDLPNVRNFLHLHVMSPSASLLLEQSSQHILILLPSIDSLLASRRHSCESHDRITFPRKLHITTLNLSHREP